jgi:hypothetical protein
VARRHKAQRELLRQLSETMVVENTPTVEAQVAYLERHQTGLVFLDRTGHDRDEALQLMTLLAK